MDLFSGIQRKQKLARLLAELRQLTGMIDIPRRIEVAGEALALVDQQKDRLLWGDLHFTLGNCFEYSREIKRSQRLESAIQHYEMALAAYCQATAHPERQSWILTTLGVFYNERQEGDPGDNLEQAIAHLTAALEYYNRQDHPIEWGVTQYNLGRAYCSRIEGERAANLATAAEHTRQAIEVFPPEHPQDLHRRAQVLLNEIHGPAQRVIPVRPGLHEPFVRKWQMEKYRLHEADEEANAQHPVINPENAAYLHPAYAGNFESITAVKIYSSRWIILIGESRTMHRIVYSVLDAREDRVAFRGEGLHDSWLEMVHLGPYAVLPVERGMLVTSPVDPSPYEDVFIWEYDQGGDAYGNHINLLTGEKCSVYSIRGRIGDWVYIPIQADLSQPSEGWGSELMEIPGIICRCRDSGEVIVSDSSRTELARLQAGSSACLALATPNHRTLITITQDGEVKLWHAAE